MKRLTQFYSDPFFSWGHFRALTLPHAFRPSGTPLWEPSKSKGHQALAFFPMKSGFTRGTPLLGRFPLTRSIL